MDTDNLKEKFPEGLMVHFATDEAFLLLQYKREKIGEQEVGYLLMSYYPSFEHFKHVSSYLGGYGPQLFLPEHLPQAVEAFFDRSVFASHILTSHELTVNVLKETHQNEMDWTPFTKLASLSELRQQVRQLVPSHLKTITD